MVRSVARKTGQSTSSICAGTTVIADDQAMPRQSSVAFELEQAGPFSRLWPGTGARLVKVKVHAVIFGPAREAGVPCTGRCEFPPSKQKWHPKVPLGDFAKA